MGIEKNKGRRDGNPGGFFNRIAVDTATDGGERKRSDFFLCGQIQTVCIACGEQGAVRWHAAVNRADGMDDIIGRQTKAGRYPGFTGGAPADLAAGGQQFRTGGAVDGAVNTPAAQQRGIGGIDNGTNLQAGDIAPDNFESLYCFNQWDAFG